MTLRTTELGIRLIKAFEGCRLRAYRCPAGVWTIGYGHTTAAGAPRVFSGVTITQVQAEAILRDDVDHFEDQVEKLLVGHMPNAAHQFDALVSFAYNVGIGAFAKSTLLAKVKLGKFEDVPAQFMRWNKADGKELAGLTRRRRAEAAMWRGDMEEVEKYTGMDFGDMPQVVDAPAPPKTMAQSSIGNGAIITAVASVPVTFKAVTDTVQSVSDQAKLAADTLKGATDAGTKVAIQVNESYNTLGHIGPYIWLAFGLAALGGALYVWMERRRLLKEEHV